MRFSQARTTVRWELMPQPVSKMRIVLFARHADPTASAIADGLKRLGTPYAWVSLSSIAQGTPAVFDGFHYTVDERPLHSFRAYWLHQHPSESAQLFRPEETSLSCAEWWTRTQLQKDRVDFAKGLLSDLDQGGAFGVNSFTRSAKSVWKPAQLSALRRAGLPLPPTLISNIPEQILEFIAVHREVIVKPVAGGAHAQLWGEAHRERLEQVREAPAIFQRRVRGKNVRVTVVNDEIISAVEIPSTHIDYRADPAYVDGSLRYVPHSLRGEGRVFALEAARACGHVVSGVDLIDGGDGYTVLEANGAPRFLDIERKTGAEISARIAALLVGQSNAS